MPDRLALLRGINVGGKNPIRMADLRAAFEDLGYEDVATYIQSGNVLFRSPREPRAELVARLERELTAELGLELRAVLLGEPQLRRVVEGAPAGFGAEDCRCDVIFPHPPLTAARAHRIAETREGVDRKWKANGVVYLSRLDARASGSRLVRITQRPEYGLMTIRNWRTTRKLLDLFERRAAG